MIVSKDLLIYSKMMPSIYEGVKTVIDPKMHNKIPDNVRITCQDSSSPAWRYARKLCGVQVIFKEGAGK